MPPQDSKPPIPAITLKDSLSSSGILSEAKAKDIKLEYELWDRSHKSMKESPPSEGRDYLKHAKNLLNLLEGIAELHPIAKATVATFKAILLFEDDRRENDARVAAVFLAQTDMMRVLLDIDHLANRRPIREHVEYLRTSMSIADILDRIQAEIKICGNSVDTYYKERRLLKFWKSADWKQRMLGHIEEFNGFRLLLQQALSIQVASGVDDLGYKMDMLLTSLFSSKTDWEKELASQSRRLGKIESWIDDGETLKSLVLTSKDPSLEMNVDKPGLEISAKLQQLKKDLGVSLDTLCERNLNMFELKLNLHTQKMEETIVNSARFVVRTLSGPYDRLHNEDLRELWKEMNWIFCVDNKLFASALFEYYLDKFSAVRPKREHNTDAQLEDEKPGNEPLDQVELSLASAPHSGFFSRLSSLNHPDAWTLECIARNGHQIATAIDTDNSGFIRISEANHFAEQMPKEWNLPQWCAYVAAGRAYEARIYRKRINYALTKITELQVSVLSSNRAYLLVWMQTILWIGLQDLSREPQEQNHPSVPLELRSAVKNKIHSQDTKIRESLRALNWTLEDPSTIRLVYGDKPVETYILQVAFLMSEYLLQAVQACCTVTLDLREWERFVINFIAIRSLAIQRVEALKDILDSEPASTRTMKSYHGGIWACLDARINAKAFGMDFSPYPYTLEEASDYLSDIDVLDEFPLPSLPIGTLPYLRYTPWEEFVKTMNDSEIPASIPRTWSPFDESYLEVLPGRQQLLQAVWDCNVCGANHRLDDRKHHCVECIDFDLCIECLSLPPDKQNVDTPKNGNHKYEHLLMCQSLQFGGEHAERTAWEARLALEELREALSAARRSSTLPATNNSVCGSCSAVISEDPIFYTCLVRSCRGLYLCMKCVQAKKDATGEHQLWHTLLVVRKELVDVVPETKPPTAPISEETPDVEAKAEIAEDPRHATIISSIADIDVRINTMRGTLESNHSALEERISRIESKMDGMMTELRKLLVAFATNNSPTT